MEAALQKRASKAQRACTLAGHLWHLLAPAVLCVRRHGRHKGSEWRLADPKSARQIALAQNSMAKEMVQFFSMTAGTKYAVT